MKRKSHGRTDYATEQRRRIKAGPLFAQGHSQATVARRLSVSRQTASRWFAAWQVGGAPELGGVGRVGRKPKLSQNQLHQLEQYLLEGPQAHGYRTNLWTLKRIAKVVRRKFGVRYHPGHVWKLLGLLRWSCQRPQRRARERDETAIRGWVKRRWPRVKKKPASVAHG